MDTLSSVTLTLAVATFLMAVAAFLAIWQNYKFKEKDRKERLLNEVIEWAMDVGKCGFETDEEAPNAKAALEGRTDFTLSYGFIKAHRAAFQNGYKNIRWLNQYIQNIVVNNFLKELPSANTLIDELNNHLAMLYEDRIGKNRDATPVIAQDIAKHNLFLDELTKEVMREAANIKTGNIK
jgi:hypothetical protein